MTEPGVIDRRIRDVQLWAARAGLRGEPTVRLFEEFCHRLLAAGVPLWRGFAGVQTLHPQWGGYSLTWWRDRDAVEPVLRQRGEDYDRDLRDSPFGGLMQAMRDPDRNLETPLRVRRRLSAPEAQLDFPVLERLAEAGATDYVADLVAFGIRGDPSRGTGMGYAFATDRPNGFSDDDLRLIGAVVPTVSLAIMADTGYAIAAGLVTAYLGEDAGRRVHAGAIERGSVESLRAVLWCADTRGFTSIADMTSGLDLIEMLNDIFEVLTAALRPRGGHVLKFMGDGMLAIFPVDAAREDVICGGALDAAIEAMDGIARLTAARRRGGKPAAAVDLALHLGEVLYGNVGAVDRLDFTVIGPAVNEVARIETLCEPLGRNVLVSATFAAALGDGGGRLERLGAHPLRGLRETREIYGLRL